MKKIKILILCIVAIILISGFVGSVSASTSGDENRTSHSQRLGDDKGQSPKDPIHNRAEDRMRMEDR